jgi:hypothetical protein
MTKLAIKNFGFKGHSTKNKGISKAFQPKIKIFSENNTPLSLKNKGHTSKIKTKPLEKNKIASLDMTNGCVAIVTCTTTSCGPNAVCKVENNTILCQCKLGTTGNPFDMKDGCRTFVATASMWGDPHYTTFDGQKFDWHGICPYIYSMNCKPGNIAPYEDFKVKARNTNIWPDEKGKNRPLA